MQRYGTSGRWEPSGRKTTTGTPLTTIIQFGDFNYANWRNKVGNKIMLNTSTGNVFHSQFLQMYSDIQDIQINFPPVRMSNNLTGNSRAQRNEKYAKAAKFAAFIFFLNISSEKPVSGVFETIDSTSTNVLHHNWRDSLKQIAINYLNQIDPSFEGNTGITNEQLQYESKALIMALEAYDLLNTAGVSGLTEIKLHLQYLAFQIHHKADDILFGKFYRINNHNLMTSAALGLASIVLHDCGHSIFSTGFHPYRWANRANYEIQRVLFDEDLAMSNSDGTAGYAEGPHYFQYAFENLLPFFIAYNSYQPDDHATKYYKYVFSTGYKTVQSHFYHHAYSNMFDWYSKIVMPNGLLPPIDATFNFEGVGDLLGCFVDASTDTKKFPFNFWAGTVGSGTGMEVEYIANANPPDVPLIQKDFSLPIAGVGVLQNLDYNSDFNKRIYLITLGENGKATNGGGHEHGDAGSFLITAGNDQLAIDPGFLGYPDALFTPLPVGMVNDGTDHNVITILDSTTDGAHVGPYHTTEGHLGPIMDGGSGQKYIENTWSFNDVNFKRRITSIAIGDNYFYIIRDSCGSSFTKSLRWTFNGSGNQNQSSFSYITPDKKVFQYDHRCHDTLNSLGETHWAIRGAVAVKDTATSRGERTDENEELGGTIN